MIAAESRREKVRDGMRRGKSAATPPSRALGKKAKDVLIASAMGMRLHRNCNALERTLEELLAVSECPSNADGDLLRLVSKIKMFRERKGI